MTHLDLQVDTRYAEDLAAMTFKHAIGHDQLLGLNPPCHPQTGFTLVFDSLSDTVVMLCKECNEPCGALRIARKLRAS